MHLRRLGGGAGNDTFTAASTADGADVFNGGTGDDTVDYSSRTAALTVTMDGVAANDGLASETDDVKSDIEILLCGSAADTITGNDGDNRIEGGAGADTLNGGDGDDELFGGAGDDTINGGDGDDTLDGGDDDDDLDCGTGDGDIGFGEGSGGSITGCEL